MCGIFGYVGKRDAASVLINGLKRLEYRGYDSAGMATLHPIMHVVKSAKHEIPKDISPIRNLANKIRAGSNIGIAHTRWATHGEPNSRNAHPHVSGNIAVVHNGIIENYHSLRKFLIGKGCSFASETDSEVIAHLVAQNLKDNGSLLVAVQKTLSQIDGTYGIALLCEGSEEIIAARNGSPLLIGIGDDEFFVSSDPAPINDYTKRVIYLDDREVARIAKNGFKITDLRNQDLEKNIENITWSIKQIELEGHDHFMQKEIFEQPLTVTNAFRGRLDTHGVRLDGLREIRQKGIIDRVRIVACGTSWHAGLIGKFLLEGMARIPVEVDYASEFRYRKPIISDGELVMAISQSGETADTLAALKLANQKTNVFGIVNSVGSLITKATDAGIYIHAGPEIGVASTKAFTGQVTCLFLLALQLGIDRGIIRDYQANKSMLESIPGKISNILEAESCISGIAEHYSRTKNCLFLGRGINYPVALEGALKLKEISGIHAEGYPAAEMKHGPIALIDKDMPVIFIATGRDIMYQKVLSNMEEVRAREGKIIALVNHEDDRVKRLSNHIISVPETSEYLSPLLNVIPLQLLAYFMAVNRGKNPDKPENLAKAVTVE